MAKREDYWWRKYTKKRLGAPPAEKQGQEASQAAAPAGDACLEDEINRMFSALMGGAPLRISFKPRLLKMDGGMFRAPNYNVKDTGKEMVVRVELPGVRKEDIRLHIDRDNLIVESRSEKRSERSAENSMFASRSYRGYRQIIPLPSPARTDGSRARYENGVLIVALRKEEGGGGPSDIEVE